MKFRCVFGILQDYGGLPSRCSPAVRNYRAAHRMSFGRSGILKRFKHHEKLFEDDIQIELVSGSVRVTLE